MIADDNLANLRNRGVFLVTKRLQGSYLIDALCLLLEAIRYRPNSQ
jgi:hypothetical protein